MLRLRCIGVSQTKDGGGEWPGVSGAKQTRAIGLDLFEARHGHGRVRSRSSTAGDGPPSRLMSGPGRRDRKSTRLNSSHPVTSYAVFCLKTEAALDGIERDQRAADSTAAVPAPPRVL